MFLGSEAGYHVMTRISLATAVMRWDGIHEFPPDNQGFTRLTRLSHMHNTIANWSARAKFTINVSVKGTEMTSFFSQYYQWNSGIQWLDHPPFLLKKREDMVVHPVRYGLTIEFDWRLSNGGLRLFCHEKNRFDDEASLGRCPRVGIVIQRSVTSHATQENTPSNSGGIDSFLRRVPHLPISDQSSHSWATFSFGWAGSMTSLSSTERLAAVSARVRCFVNINFAFS